MDCSRPHQDDRMKDHRSRGIQYTEKTAGLQGFSDGNFSGTAADGWKKRNGYVILSGKGYQLRTGACVLRFRFDHDLHIHSRLSACSCDPGQTGERILQYARDCGLHTVCLTDHMWDSAVPGASDWYRPQNYEHICLAKPLPRDKDIRFLFGCETEMDRRYVLGISRPVLDALDFIAVPTTHLLMTGFTISQEDAATHTGLAAAWVSRLDSLLDRDLPFEKMGVAHLTTSAIGPGMEQVPETLRAIPESEMERLFSKAASAGIGIELNAAALEFDEKDADIFLKPYRIAKSCGCHFYCGSDAHRPGRFGEVKEIFERAISRLNLQERDKIDLLLS